MKDGNLLFNQLFLLSQFQLVKQTAWVLHNISTSQWNLEFWNFGIFEVTENTEWRLKKKKKSLNSKYLQLLSHHNCRILNDDVLFFPPKYAMCSCYCKAMCTDSVLNVWIFIGPRAKAIYISTRLPHSHVIEVPWKSIMRDRERMRERERFN